MTILSKLRFGAVVLLAVASVALTGTAAHAQTPDSINTTNINGDIGYFEFAYAYNPVGGPGAASTVDVTDISNGIGGTSPAVSLNNSTTPLGVPGPSDTGLVPFTFGPTFSFDYQFENLPLPSLDPGDDLLLYLYYSNQTSVPTTDPSGSDLAADINISCPPGALDVITVNNFAITPEASTLVAMSAGLLGLLAVLAFPVMRRRAYVIGAAVK